jgi:hypothetical protein
LLRSIGARIEVLERRFEDLAVPETAESELEPLRIPTLALITWQLSGERPPAVPSMRGACTR